MESPRNAFRRAVRERAFALATEHLKTQPWEQLRIGQLAGEVGVSRPTIYAEFGSKEGFGEALVLNEVNRFLSEVNTILEVHTDKPIKGLEKATAFAFKEAARSPVVRAIFNSNSAGTGDDRSLAPFVTTRALPVVSAANEQLYAWFKSLSPNSTKREVVESVDALTRLVVSNMMSPDGRPDQVASRMGRIAKKLFPELTDQ